jgi:hypothetical protein
MVQGICKRLSESVVSLAGTGILRIGALFIVFVERTILFL